MTIQIFSFKVQMLASWPQECRASSTYWQIHLQVNIILNWESCRPGVSIPIMTVTHSLSIMKVSFFFAFFFCNLKFLLISWLGLKVGIHLIGEFVLGVRFIIWQNTRVMRYNLSIILLNLAMALTIKHFKLFTFYHFNNFTWYTQTCSGKEWWIIIHWVSRSRSHSLNWKVSINPQCA